MSELVIVRCPPPPFFLERRKLMTSSHFPLFLEIYLLYSESFLNGAAPISSCTKITFHLIFLLLLTSFLFLIFFLAMKTDISLNRAATLYLLLIYPCLTQRDLRLFWRRQQVQQPLQSVLMTITMPTFLRMLWPRCLKPQRNYNLLADVLVKRVTL